MFTLPNLIIFAGLIQLSILLVAAMVPKVLNWREQLALLHPFVRQMYMVYGAFIFLIVAAFTAFSILLAEDLASGSTFARSVAGLIALFWGARLCVQLFVFRFPEFVKSRALKFGYHMLTPAFAYLAAVFAFAAVQS